MKPILILSLLISVSSLAQKTDSLRATPAQPARTGYVISQQERQQMVDMASAPGMGVGNVRTFDQRYEGLRGTPYMFPYWAKGYVVLTTGQRYDKARIKYDAYHQELLITQPPIRPDSILIDRERVSWFVIQTPDSNGAILFRRFPDLRAADANLKNSYYRVLSDGPHTLLQRISKTFRPASYQGTYSRDVRYDAFDNKTDYYILSPDQRLSKVKLTTKSLLAALTEDLSTQKAPRNLDDLRKQTVGNEAQAAQFVKDFDGGSGTPSN
ncbi:hypothetical protein [Spirosoma rhododendri]|uniref:Outer membrane lipoprotein-sorting protein n=1 Tax=Spirosoma rhododendri TaxID=2728024 RepID=A0A7L5DXI9_9BACT|nr:hypothetical protein [Spirosoma rhododendri]QJD80240.1 hypothetical protein HH216_18810 [Spirosoma rhododendri]